MSATSSRSASRGWASSGRRLLRREVTPPFSTHMPGARLPQPRLKLSDVKKDVDGQVKRAHSVLPGMLDSMLLRRYEKAVRPEGLQWRAWSDEHWNRAWKGMAHFEKQAEMLARPQLDIAQIGLVCVLGYADFRFADCGWRKAYPKLDAFHQKMLERPSVKISVLPPA